MIHKVIFSLLCALLISIVLYKPQTADVVLYEHPTWSPDGKYITFQSNIAGTYDIWLANIDGKKTTNLTQSGEAKDTLPKWHPNGEDIAFLSDYGGITSLSIVNLNTKRVSTLIQPALGKIITEYHWSNSGQYIAYVEFDISKISSQINVLDVQTKEVFWLTAEENMIYPNIAWSPLDESIAYIGTHTSATNEGNSIQNRHIGMISLDRTQILLIDNRTDIALSWSQQNQILLLDGVNLSLWLLTPNNNEIRHLIEFSGVTNQPIFSPDGQQIAAVLASPKSKGDIWIIYIDKDLRLNITSTIIGKKINPTWSPDGQQIAFENYLLRSDGLGILSSDIWISDLDGNSFNLTSQLEFP